MDILRLICGVIATLWLIRFFINLNGKPITKTKPKTGVFGYKLFYADTNGATLENVGAKVLTSQRYALRGKPDAVYKSVLGVNLAPVELKSGTIGEKDAPHRGDLMQLAAYFLLIEDCYGVRPKFGHLIYKDAMFKVKNSGKLRSELLGIIKDMKQMQKTGSEEVNPDFAKCRYCVCQGTVCEFC